MNSNIEKLKTILSDFIETLTDKDQISTLAKASETIDAIDADYKAVDTSLKDVMKDYKELIKHTSFIPREVPARAESEAPKIEDIISKVLKDKN